MIKYFACGFLIATTTAFVFECVTLHLVSKLILMFLPIQVESDEGYGMSGFSFFDLSPYHMYEYTAAASAFSQQHPNISVIFLFFSAYCVAALVEEACKYFGYCIVEHPDFVSERDLTKAASYGVPVQSEGEPEDDRFEWGGGLECISGNEESSLASMSHLMTMTRNLAMDNRDSDRRGAMSNVNLLDSRRLSWQNVHRGQGNP